MPKFKFKITKCLYWKGSEDVEIEAKNYDEAQDKVTASAEAGEYDGILVPRETGLTGTFAFPTD